MTRETTDNTEQLAVTGDTPVSTGDAADFGVMGSQSRPQPVSRFALSLSSTLPPGVAGGVAYERAPAAKGTVVEFPLERLEGPAFEIVEVDMERAGVRFGGLSIPAGGEHLESATAHGFGQILAECRASGHPHLLRVWAAVPGINDESCGIERYRAFSRARAEQFESSWGERFESRLCASSAVGHSDERLVIAYLASRWPGVQIENPRQISAFHYPEDYGPRSPSFARGTLTPSEVGEALFVSGTASIVGHESVHRGDVEKQTDETIRNLETVLDRARETAGRRYDMKYLKVFVRRSSDFDRVKQRLAASRWSHCPTLFLRADICRFDLLIEIEGVAEAV